MGKQWKQCQTWVFWAPKSLQMVTEAMKFKDASPWKESYDQPRYIFKSRDITLPTKVHLIKAMVFPVVLCRCQSWTVKKSECRKIDAFELWCWEKTLESLLNCEEVQSVHPKGDQFWVFIGRTDAKAETPVLWPPHAKSWLIGKDSNAGRDWGQVEKGTTEDEMTGWHHRLVGHEIAWTSGVGDRQGGLACCNSWGRKESDTTEWLNWTELN